MTMPAKRNTKKSTKKSAASREEQVRAELSKKTPMRLHKYAVGVLNIPAEVVDSWNDYDFMVDYCVKKTLGLELPEEPKKRSVSLEDDGEFDASDLDDDTEDTEDTEESEEEFDDEMESPDGEVTFGDPEDEEEPEPEPEPEPKPKKTRRARRTKKEMAAEREESSTDNDVQVAIGQLLDVITNQGMALETLQQSNDRVESMCKEMYIRQEASHGALSTIGKAVFSMSTILSEFVPRVLKVMRFKPSVSKEIRNKADSAGVDAKELFDSLIDPDTAEVD